MSSDRFASTRQPLAQFGLFRSTDLDETRQIVASKFCDHRLDRLGVGERLSAVHNHVQGQAISLNYLKYGATVRIAPGCLEDFYLVQIPLAGGAQVTHGRARVNSHSGMASLLNPHIETDMIWNAACEQILMQINRRKLQDFVATCLGYTPSQDVTFAPDLNLKTPEGRSWAQAVKTCVRAAEMGHAFVSTRNRLSQPLLEERLLQGLLMLQPSSVHDALQRRPAQVSNRYVRRAQDFIHANLTNPVTAELIAQTAGTSLRNLQYAFREHFGCSPLEYLRAERLSYSHMELRRGEETVARIANRAGFTHLSRFSRAYKQRYGYLPSETRAHVQKL